VDFAFLGSGFRASDWISWISLFSFGLYKGGFRKEVDFVDFAYYAVDFVPVTGFRGFRFLGRPLLFPVTRGPPVTQ